MICSEKHTVNPRWAGQLTFSPSKQQNQLKSLNDKPLADVVTVWTNVRIRNDGQYVASCASRIFYSMRTRQRSNVRRECIFCVPRRNCSLDSVKRLCILLS